MWKLGGLRQIGTGNYENCKESDANWRGPGRRVQFGGQT
jgi:hypothetical protein